MNKTRKILTDSNYAMLAPLAHGTPRCYFKLGSRGGLQSADLVSDHYQAPSGSFGGAALPPVRTRASVENYDHPQRQ